MITIVETFVRFRISVFFFLLLFFIFALSVALFHHLWLYVECTYTSHSLWLPFIYCLLFESKVNVSIEQYKEERTNFISFFYFFFLNWECMRINCIIVIVQNERKYSGMKKERNKYAGILSICLNEIGEIGSISIISNLALVLSSIFFFWRIAFTYQSTWQMNGNVIHSIVKQLTLMNFMKPILSKMLSLRIRMPFGSITTIFGLLIDRLMGAFIFFDFV